MALTQLASAQQTNPVREASRKVVDDCAATLPVGWQARVEYTWSSTCRKPGPELPHGLAQSEHAHYTMAREADGIHIKAKLRFKIAPARTTSARARLLLDRSRACMADLNQYWNRYGITLDFTVDSDRNKTPGPADYDLTLTDGAGRSHSRNHYFQGLDSEQVVAGIKVKVGPAQACLSGCRSSAMVFGGAAYCEELCEPVRQKEFCLMVLHETGHLLGLPDEYADPMCPDRPFVSNEQNPWSVMAIPYYGALDDTALLASPLMLQLSGVEFFPRHLQTIMSQACPLVAVPGLNTPAKACGEHDDAGQSSGVATCTP
jgi:hypothetical protein